MERRALVHLVEQYVAHRPELATSKGAFDRCDKVAAELIAFLADRGVEAKAVRLVGYKGGIAGAHPKWREISSHGWTHYAVVVGNDVVDCTARQFDPAMPFPSVQPVAGTSSLWNEAYVLSDLRTGEAAGPLRPTFDPQMYEDGGLFYDDGFVHAAIDELLLENGRKGLTISEWSSYDPGQGHTVRALEWLRQRYATIAANGVGMVDEVDGEPVGDISTQYWQHMRSKGLVDVLLDDEGIEMDENNRPVRRGMVR